MMESIVKNLKVELTENGRALQRFKVMVFANHGCAA